MMADGSFEALGMADPKTKSGKAFAPGDLVSFVVKDDEPSTLTIGDEYADNRTWKICRLIRGIGESWWDDANDRYVSSKPRSATEFDLLYDFAVVEWEDGTTTHLSAQYLWGALDDPKHLKKPPLNFLSYDDMVNLPDKDWLIDGLIMEKTSAVMFGKSNSFKSFLAVDGGCSLATGTSWHGQKIAAPQPVLYVATEGALGVAKQRIPGWMEAHNIPHHLRQNIRLYDREIALDDDKAITDLLTTAAYIKARKTLEGGGKVWNDKDPRGAFALVIVDIFGASMKGPETSDETARAWVSNINRIMREMDCAVLTVAHTGWADETRARMHTHFWGSFDTRLKAVGDKDSLTSVLSIDRHKDADSAGEWGFRLDKVTLSNGQTTLVPRLCDDVEKGQKRRVSGKPAVALQALSEALIDHGKTIAGPNYPAGRVVDLDTWRTMTDRHGLTDSDNPETRRKAFTRAKDALIEKGLVRQFDNHVWKVNADA